MQHISEALHKSDFISDFLRGQKDCSDGVPHKAGMSEAYDRGYAAQYQGEQNKTHYTRRLENV